MTRVLALVLALGSVVMAQEPVPEPNGWTATVTYLDADGQVQTYEKLFVSSLAANEWAEKATDCGFSREWIYGNGDGASREWYPANRIRRIVTRPHQ